MMAHDLAIDKPRLFAFKSIGETRSDLVLSAEPTDCTGIYGNSQATFGC